MGGILSKIFNGLFYSEDSINTSKSYERVNLLDDNDEYEEENFDQNYNDNNDLHSNNLDDSIDNLFYKQSSISLHENNSNQNFLSESEKKIEETLQEPIVNTSENPVVQFVEENLNATDSILWGIWTLEPDRLVGSVRLHNMDDETNSCDIGVCVFDRSVWGKGVASRAIREVCNWGYEYLDLQTVVAGIEAENLGSWKAFTKAGFVSPEGIEDQIGANKILNPSVHVVARLPLIVSC